MVGDGLPPTPNSKSTLQSHSVNTTRFISIEAAFANFYDPLKRLFAFM